MLHSFEQWKETVYQLTNTGWLVLVKIKALFLINACILLLPVFLGAASWWARWLLVADCSFYSPVEVPGSGAFKLQSTLARLLVIVSGTMTVKAYGSQVKIF